MKEQECNKKTLTDTCIVNSLNSETSTINSLRKVAWAGRRDGIFLCYMRFFGWETSREKKCSNEMNKKTKHWPLQQWIVISLCTTLYLFTFSSGKLLTIQNGAIVPHTVFDIIYTEMTEWIAHNLNSQCWNLKNVNEKREKKQTRYCRNKS